MLIEDLPTSGLWDAWDWGVVFSVDGNWASRPEIRTLEAGEGQPAPHGPALTVDSVAAVEAWWADNPEGYASRDFAAVLRLTDGRWAAVTAWADTTGWGCQDGTEIIYCADRGQLIRFGLSDTYRERLGLAIGSSEAQS